MSEHFLRLAPKEQSAIYRSLAAELGRSPLVLEKDVWVCWALQTLFSVPYRLPMAFKGGTSLSKVFGLISRFSEDVDITLDFRGLDASFDPFESDVSKARLKKFGEQLKGLVHNQVHDVIAPRFSDRLAREVGTEKARVEIGDDGETMRVYYPSALDGADGYIGNSVLLEFGGRNIIEPNQDHLVVPDIAGRLPDLTFPAARVTVLSPQRTFWEKATLIHVECHRLELRSGAERLSRHWYDLAMLSDSDIGRQAIRNRDLLIDVVKLKAVFYNATYANYDACLAGNLRLIPDDAHLRLLHQDFSKMIDAGMFFGTTPVFDEILDRLHALEVDINNLEKNRRS